MAEAEASLFLSLISRFCFSEWSTEDCRLVHPPGPRHKDMHGASHYNHKSDSPNGARRTLCCDNAFHPRGIRAASLPSTAVRSPGAQIPLQKMQWAWYLRAQPSKEGLQGLPVSAAQGGNPLHSSRVCGGGQIVK